MSDALGFETHLSLDHDAAITLVTQVLKDEGFGVLTRIDIDQAFREKIGAEFRAYTILGACNPMLAHTALTAQAELGLMLPCNVTVEADDGGSIVRIVNPTVMMGVGALGTDETVAHVASDATARLERVAAKLRSHP